MRRGPREDYSALKGRQNHQFRCSDALLVFGHFPAEIHLCQRIACLLLAFLNHMAVDILRGGTLIGGALQTIAEFQLQNILCVLLKSLIIFHNIALLQLLLKAEGFFLGCLVCLFIRHIGIRFIGCAATNLFAIKTISGTNRNMVGSFTAFGNSFFNT